MNWVDAETTLRAYIQSQWALGAYASMPLEFENETVDYSTSYMAIMIEGTYCEKTIYGSVGKRSSIEAGMIFFHAFIPTGQTKLDAVGPIVALTRMLELQTIGTEIKLDGGNPPSPVERGVSDDIAIPRLLPSGNYYRCSGSVPFIVTDTR